MKILFYVEPLIEQDKPYWKDVWIDVFCRKIIDTLKQSKNSYEFLIMTNEAIAHKVDIETYIITLTQQELLQPFATTNYLDVTTAWHCAKFNQKQLESYKKLMLNKLNGFVPDIIITFSPAPFFKEIFDKALILHHEYSIFSRLPYPQSWFFDPVGMHSYLFLNKFKDEIKSIKLSKDQHILVNNFKELCQNTLSAKSPFKNIFNKKRKQFDYLIFLPLQFSRYYSFDDLVPFKSQYEYCVYILDHIPSHIGVVMNMHPEYPAISSDAIKFLKSKYTNFIYEEYFDTIYASGQFILPFVDAVITVSSSIGLQTLFFDNKLVTLSDKTFSFIADCTNINDIERILASDYVDKDSFLYFILSRHAITEKYLYNTTWLDNFFTNSLDKFRKENIKSNFYDPIDEDKNIFENLSRMINDNSNSVPQIVKNYIQIYIGEDGAISEENSIKLPVLNSNELQIFEFDLKNFKNVKSLRLDVLNDACIVELKKINMVLDNKIKIDLKPLISRTSYSNNDNNYFFDSINSQIYFENIDFSIYNISKIIVEIKYTKISNDALKNIIEQKENYIQEQRNIIEQKENYIQEQTSIIEQKENYIQEQRNIIEQKENYIQEQTSIIEQKENYIQEQRNIIEQKENYIQEQTSIIEQKENYIQEQTSIIEQKENYIQEQTSIIEQKENYIQEQTSIIEQKENYIQEQTSIIGQKENYIQEQTSIIEQKENYIQEQTSIIGQKENYIQEQTSIIEQKENYIQEQTSIIERFNRNFVIKIFKKLKFLK